MFRVAQVRTLLEEEKVGRRGVANAGSGDSLQLLICISLGFAACLTWEGHGKLWYHTYVNPGGLT